MTLQDVAIIERLVRQSSYNPNVPEEAEFGDWISVDQQQALDLIEMIPNRLPCGPLSTWWQDLHLCAAPGCEVSIPKEKTLCWTHGSDWTGAV